MKAMLEAREASGYEAIVITVDTAVLGRRERDVLRRIHLAAAARAVDPDRRRAAPRVDVGVRARGADRVRECRRCAVDDGSDPVSLSEYIGRAVSNPSLSWAVVEWSAPVGTARSCLKGCSRSKTRGSRSTPASTPSRSSNHGGRQLDGAPAPIDRRRARRRGRRGSIEIICDGGVRRGSDIVKALALGADACMIGRAYLYASPPAASAASPPSSNQLAGGFARGDGPRRARAVDALTPDLVHRRR